MRLLRDLPLVWKLMLPFAVLLLLTGAVGAFLTVRDLRSRAQAALDQDLQRATLEARAIVADHELYVLESATLAANLQGMASAVAAGDTAATTSLMQSVLALKQDLDVLAVIGADAGFIVDLGTPIRSVGTSELPFVLEVLTSTDGSRRASVAAVADHQMLLMAAPICQELDGCSSAGAVVVGVGLDGIVDDIVAGAPADAGVALFGRDGQSLAAAGDSTKQPPPSIPPAGSVRRAEQLNSEPVQTLHAPLELQSQVVGSIAVSLPEAPLFAGLRGTALGLGAVVLVALAAIVAIGVLLSRAILRQVESLVATNRALGDGDLGVRAPVVSRDEIGELARGLNDMADQLQASHATLEARVEERTAEVERLLEQRTQFFASLSHELRTPLAVVLSQAGMLRTGTAPDPGRTGEVIEQATRALLAAVNEILDLARAESGALAVTLLPADLTDVVSEVSTTLTAFAEQAGVALEFDVPADLPPVAADAVRLRDVISNLVDNAIKYTPTGGTATLRAEVHDGQVVLEVEDTGMGIPSEVGDQIFEPFFRVEGSAPVHGARSTGLGLALTRRLVEAHGGTLTYKSTPDVGTTFRFSLAHARDATSANGDDRAGKALERSG